MLTTTILAAALMMQSPPPAPRPYRPPQADRIAAKKAALRRQNIQRERAEAMAAAQAAMEAQAEYERMLPYMLEQQRQMLQRQSDIERNAALNKIGDAALWSSWRGR